MDILQNLTVTDIYSVVTVFSPKGKEEKIDDRPCYGLSLCYDGQITYHYDGVNYVSQPDCAIILPKGKTYTLYRNKEGHFPLINFDCKEPLCDRHVVLPLKNPAPLIKDYEYLKKLSLFERNRAKMMSVFYSLIDDINFQTDDGASLISGAVAYLEANLSDPLLTNGMLAERANISEVYFRQLFQKQFGISPRQYIINARIAKAKQMLSAENKKISAVAEECGFQSVYHFCRCFKEKVGVTPTEYLNSNRILRL